MRTKIKDNVMRIFPSATITFFFIAANTVSQVIPNNGFENWSGMNPDAWETTNPSTISTSPFLITKTKKAAIGNYAIELTNRKVKDLGMVIGMAASGHLDPANNYSVTGGFPFSDKPGKLTGLYQNMAGFGNDTSAITVYLFKYNTITSERDTIAFGELLISEMNMNYELFLIPLVYSCSHAPDSALIILSVSKDPRTAADNSYLIVDDLEFSDTATFVDIYEGFANPEFTTVKVKVSPFLAKYEVFVNFHEELEQKYHFTLIDSYGREVFNSTLTQQFTTINTMSFQNGDYIYRIVGEDNMRIGSGRIVINH